MSRSCHVAYVLSTTIDSVGFKFSSPRAVGRRGRGRSPELGGWSTKPNETREALGVVSFGERIPIHFEQITLSLLHAQPSSSEHDAYKYYRSSASIFLHLPPSCSICLKPFCVTFCISIVNFEFHLLTHDISLVFTNDGALDPRDTYRMSIPRIASGV